MRPVQPEQRVLDLDHDRAVGMPELRTPLLERNLLLALILLLGTRRNNHRRTT